MRNIPLSTSHYESLEVQEKYVHLVRIIESLKEIFKAHYPKQGTLYNISSTEHGGGVAEMMPKIMHLLSELGATAKWAVIETKEKEFFELTKHLHNNIHAEGEPLSQWKGHNMDRLKQLYETVNLENAKDFINLYQIDQDHDLVIVHDPQPASIILGLKQQFPRLKFVWRCHIGVDVMNMATIEAWRFLTPYLSLYDACTYSAKEYIQKEINPNSFLVHPGISPLSEKNKELSAYQIMQVLMRADLAGQHYRKFLVDEHFQYKAAIYRGEKNPHQIHFLHRPVVTQISRWDRLKGWIPLMKAFVHLKQHAEELSRNTEFMSHRYLLNGTHNNKRHRKTLENCCLVLAGPDPKSIDDDPEGLDALQELRDFYDQLPEELSKDIMIVELPMDDVAKNAIIVNAIQRASYVIVQNSIREGFGLTATEAMYKGVCFVGTQQAVGLRTQVRDGIDGLLIHGDPADFKNVAITLNTVLGDVELHDSLAVNGAKRATNNFLIHKQVEEWIKLLPKIMGKKSKA